MTRRLPKRLPKKTGSIAKATSADEIRDGTTEEGSTEADAAEADVPEEEIGGGKCRLDKWLWHVRLVKTRSSAAALVTDGYVRVNTNRTNRPGYALKPGDVVVVVLRQGARTYKVAGFAERRGDPEAAARLYVDLAPPPPRTDKSDEPAEAADGQRERGTGRPTKRDRRLLERFKFRST